MVVVASATNRVCNKKVSAIVGDKLGHADADFLCEATGATFSAFPLTPEKLVQITAAR